MATACSAIVLPILFGSVHNRTTVTHSMSHPLGGGVVSKKIGAQKLG